MRKRQRISQVGCSLPFFIVLSLFGEIIHMDGDTYILVHRFAHQPVHNELAELATIVTVDGVCHADNHFKIVHIYVPIRVIREQTERAVSILRMNRLPFESVWMCSGRSPVRST